MDTSLDAIKLLGQVFSYSGKSISFNIYLFIAVLLSILLIVFEYLSDNKKIFIEFKNKPYYLRLTVYLILIFTIILFGYYGKMASSSFIYFKY